eukprot:435073-Pelagomonas_calceolata.AAC.2
MAQAKTRPRRLSRHMLPHASQHRAIGLPGRSKGTEHTEWLKSCGQDQEKSRNRSSKAEVGLKVSP